MVTALVLLLTACLLKGALGGEFLVSLPQTIYVLKGSCVTIPCSFDVEDKYQSNLDKTCRARWFKGTIEEPSVFDSSDAQGSTIKGQLNGDLLSKNCTTTLNETKPEHNDDYFFRVHCDNGLKYTYKQPGVQISVKADPQRPTLTPSKLEVTEGTSVSLTCSAPAPCLSLPPTLTWTPGLGQSQETLRENQDKTKVQTSVVNFTASYLHNRQEISCTAVYRKQDGSTESSVSSSLTAEITYPPKDTTVSASPSGPVQEDTNVILTCRSDANPPVRSYTWYRADGRPAVVIGTGQTLRFKALKDNGPVFCKAENELGAGRSNHTQIDVQYPPKDTRVLASPSGPVKEDTNVSLTCRGDANPTVRNYTWYRADGGLEVVIGTGQTLRFKALKDSGPVFCKAENELGVGRSNHTQIDVQYPPKDTTVSASPSGPVKEDTNVTLTCSSDANPTVRNYTWYRADGGLEVVIGTGQTLRFKALKDSGPVFCKAENELGAGRSNPTQMDVQYPPQILSSSNCTKTVDQLNCSCNTSGNPAPTVRWIMDGSSANNLDSFAVRYESTEGSVVGFISVSQTQGKDEFTLLCRSSNSLGSAAQQFYFFLAPQTSAESQDSVVVPILIATVVALLVLVCALLFLIRALKSHQNLLKSQRSGNDVSQLLPSGEGNELVKSKDKDIYVNTVELKEPDVSKPATSSVSKSPDMPHSGSNIQQGEKNISGEASRESKEIVYSSVTWRSKNEQGEEGRLSRGFVNKAVEMGNLYEEEARNVKGKNECEYAQVKFKEKK